MNDVMKAVQLVGIGLALVCLSPLVSGTDCSNERHAALKADLSLRLKPYQELRDNVKSGLAPLEETKDPAKLQGRQQALADGIRAARRAARQGDILGGPIAECLLPIIRRSLTARTAKQTMKEGNPAHEGPRTKVAVNAAYLSEAPLSTMPPRLLLDLPALPNGLEYRFVGRTLILYDADACLIVDFLPDAGP